MIEQPRHDIPVFKVKSEEGVEKTLHRNHLLPVGNKAKSEEVQTGQIPISSERKSLDKLHFPLDEKKTDASTLIDTADTVSEEIKETDETRKEDMESSNEDVYEYVKPTYIHGDAHVTTEVLEDLKPDRSREIYIRFHVDERPTGIQADYQEGATSDIRTPAVTSETGHSPGSDFEGKETRFKEVGIASEQETRNEIVSNTQIKTAVTDIGNVQEKTTTAKVSERQESITGFGNESGAKRTQIDVNLENIADRREEVEEKGENKVRQKPKPPPKPAQRRSSRERKPPA